MPEDWNFDRKAMRDPWKTQELYRGKATVVFLLPFLGHYRIAERTRFAPKMVRQSMTTYPYPDDVKWAWQNTAIYFFPWRDIGDFPIRKGQRKRPRKDRPPASGGDAP
mgnify:CR=1 FL=1